MKKLLLILFCFPFILNAQVFQAYSMSVPASGPTIVINPTFVNNFSNVTGTASSAQTVNVSWFNLTVNVTVNALANFEYSYDGTTYTSSLSIPRGPGNGDTLVYIRGTAAAATGTHGGNIQFTSTGATTINLAVTSVVSASGTATITRSPTSYSGGATTVGTPGPWQTATINGSNLTVGISVTSPAGWELSFDNGISNVSSGTISQSGGTVTNFILQFRLTGASLGSPSGNIALSSTGATTVNIAVSGTVSSATAIDSLVGRFALNRTPAGTPDFVDASINPAITPVSTPDNRNYQPVTITNIPSAWVQVNSHASSSTGGIANSTVVPANVGLGYWFTGDGVASPWVRTTMADTSIRISGLDPSKWYTIKVYVANSAVGSCGTPQYVCIGIVDSTAGNQRLDTGAYINSRLNTSVIVPYIDKRPDAGGNIWISVHASAGGSVPNCNQYGVLNSFDVIKQVTHSGFSDFIGLGLLITLIVSYSRKKKRLILGIFMLGSLSGFSQSESNNPITYDTVATLTGISGEPIITYRITRPADMFTPGSPDTASRPAIFFMPGDGEVGTDPSKLQLYGPHYLMNHGWDGSVQLGNGTHYPIIISVITNQANVRGVYMRQWLDSMRHWYHIKWNSMEFIGLSKGGITWGRVVCYQQNSSDFTTMGMMRCIAALQGIAGAVDGVNSSLTGNAQWGPFGRWANLFNGKFFGLMGTNDAQNTWFPAKNISDSLIANGKTNTAYFSMENLGPGANPAGSTGSHCCWNTMMDPSITNWLTGPQIGTNGNFPNQRGNYFEPSSVFQWMLRQGDTSLVGGGTPFVSAGPDQVVNLPTTSTTLSGTATGQGGHTISSTTWSQLSGPNTAVISNTAILNPTVSGLTSGIYVFQLSATDNASQTTVDNVTIQVVAQTPPSVSAGGDRSVTLPSNSATLVGSAAPTGGATSVTVAWTYRSGPGGSTIVSPTSTTTVINNLVQGNYVFRLTATDNNGNVNFDEAAITVLNAGSVTYIWPSVGNGEYQVSFLDASKKWWGLSGVLANIGILSGGTKGILNAIPVTPSTLQFDEARGGLHFIGGVDINHVVWTAGDNTTGQSGNGSSGGNAAPFKILVDSAGNAMQSIDHIVSYFMGNSDAGWYAYAEGGNYYYIWGATRCGARGDGSYGLAISNRPVLLQVPDGKFVQKIVSGYVSMMLCTDGSVYTCGGGNSSGTPGNAQNLGYAATGTNFLVWHLIGTNIRDIAGGKEYNYLITSTGTLMGYGFYGGYMGAANNGVRYAVPTNLTTDITSHMDGSIVELSTNHMGTFAVTTAGKAYFWGDNAQGSAGNGQEVDFANSPQPYAWQQTPYQLPVRYPLQITNKTNIAHIFSNASPFIFFTYMVDSTGQFYAWGRNKADVVANQQIICNGTLESPYPNWGDVTWATPVFPFAIATTYQSTCPLCLIHPDSPNCSDCSLAVHAGPTANAGTNQTISISTATLNGSASTGNGGGHIIRYIWSQISGPSQVVFDANAAISPKISGLQAGVYVLQLQTIDDGWNSATSTVIITVTPSVSTNCNCLSFPSNTAIPQR